MKDKNKTTPETHGHKHKADDEVAGAHAAGHEPAHDAAAGKAAQAADAETPAAERGEAVTREMLASVERERDEYLDLARRSRADYVNLQRRMETQRESVRDETRHEFAREVLSILDDIEMALKHAKEGGDQSAIVHGLEIVRTKFLATLARNGIEPMAAEGAQFDHNIHHAIAQHATDDAEPGTVYKVALQGYTSGGKLLRPAHVVVAAKPVGQDDKRADRAEKPEEKPADTPEEKRE